MPKARPKSQVAKGNIPLYDRPNIKNKDGSRSSIRSISIGTDKGEVLIPTASRGKPHSADYIMSNKEAIDRYKKTGKSLGTFRTIADANREGERIHKQQEAQMKLGPKRAAKPKGR